MTPLLSIKNLSIQFNTGEGFHTAVNQINCSIQPGELLAIVGESGSGKSITALSLLQLLPSDARISGEAIFTNNQSENNLLQLNTAAIKKIRGNRVAMIFQEPMTSLNPVFTCGQQVMEAIQQHQKISKAKAREKTIELFKKVRLPDPVNILNRYPHQLSGGQKQRVMIAMAISCEPALLIADEPTTALDVTVQQTILELIKELQVQNKMAVILITHDLGIVAEIADKIAVLYKGEMVEQGIAKDILQSPQHPYTKALLACRPAANTKGKRLPIVADFMENSSTSVEAVADSTPNNTKPTTNTKLALRVENLKVYFPMTKKLFSGQQDFFKAVEEVSFDILQGETVGLVGESGCGKTTLGRAILQLIPITAGHIFLNGKELGNYKQAALQSLRKDLQIVFQDPYGSLNPRITIGDAIMEALKVHRLWKDKKERKEQIIELLEKVSLSADHYNRYPHQFSGGQRQRICIARALALNPAFLIFDESVSALDVSVQAQVLNLLNDLKKEFGFTALFISHDLSVVHYLCDRIMVMNKGKIIETGSADDIYYHPKNEYTQQLIAAIPGKNLVSTF
ncbi:MAG: ABC transporter ATP-binding protein [Chitinophagaceae bacterium]